LCGVERRDKIHEWRKRKRDRVRIKMMCVGGNNCAAEMLYYSRLSSEFDDILRRAIVGQIIYR
jgi:hypothetical protein